MFSLVCASLLVAAITLGGVAGVAAKSITEEQVAQFREALSGVWVTVTNQGDVRDDLCTTKTSYWASEDAALRKEKPLGQISGSLQIRGTEDVNNEFWVAWNLGKNAIDTGRMEQPVLHRERLLYQLPRVLVQGMPEGELLTMIYLDGIKKDEVDIHLFLGQTTVDGKARLVMQGVAPRRHTDGSTSAAVFALVKCN